VRATNLVDVPLRNIDDFDLPYIVRRAATLPGRPDIRGLGRRRDAKISAEPTRFSSKQLGTRESFSLKGVEGVHFLDECIEVMRSRKVSSDTRQACDL